MKAGVGYLPVAVAALLARLSFALWLPIDRADRVVPDSGQYLDAMHMSMWGLPERMPLYPAYLWLVSQLTGNVGELWPVLGQCLLDTGTCLTIAVMADRIYPRAGLPAGLVAAFNPVQIVYAGFILTDTLFVFFATLALWRLVVWSETLRPAEALRAGAFIALALLVRVHIWPFAVLLPAYAIFVGLRRSQLARSAMGAAILAVSVVMPLGATAVINRANFGTFALTTQGGEHVLYWIVPLLREEQFGTGYADERERLYDKFSARYPGPVGLDPFIKADAQMALAREAMEGVGISAIVRTWAKGMVVNLFAPALTQVPAVARLPRASWYATDGDSLPARLKNYFRAAEGGAFAAYLAAGLAIETILRVAALCGLFVLVLRHRMMPSLVLLACWAVFTLLIAGPVVAPKYRLPAEPVFCIFIGAAIARAFISSSARANPATSG